MKAAIYRKYGSPDDVRVEDVPVPEPGPGEVRIRVRAASLNPADVYMLRGWPYMMRAQTGLRRPKNIGLGLDFAGEIDRVGDTTTDLRPGDAVFGEMTKPLAGLTRAFAEYLCVPADQLVRMPPTLSFEEAASMPIAGCTAMFAVRNFGGLSPGQRVLINGAGGGIKWAQLAALGGGGRRAAVCGGCHRWLFATAAGDRGVVGGGRDGNTGRATQRGVVGRRRRVL